MPIKAIQKNGPFWKKVVEIFFVGHFFLPEHGIVPPCAHDPSFARMCIGVVRQACAYFCKILGAVQMNSIEEDRSFKKMAVAVDEAGQHELPCGIDYFRPSTAKFFYGAVIADGGDFIAANRHCLDPRLLGIQGINAAVKQHDVRVFILGVLGVLRADIPGGSEKNVKNQNQDLSPACSYQPLSLPEIKMLAAY